ncbi:MAG: translation elongation factor-like protein [bacterium]|nr:translation elongation factor-like protein [bacterium]
MAGTKESRAGIARLHSKRVGAVAHYYPRAGAAVIVLEADALSIGDTIHVRGHTTDFTQKIETLRCNDEDVTSATAGQSVGIRLERPAREGDDVFVLTE